MATRLPSRLPKNTVLPRIASPRFTRPQHRGRFGGRLLSYFQIKLPVLASSATTFEGGSVMKITPPATRGVDSMIGSLLSNCLIHRTRSRETFSGVISPRDVYRQPSRDPEYVNHS